MLKRRMKKREGKVQQRGKTGRELTKDRKRSGIEMEEERRGKE